MTVEGLVARVLENRAQILRYMYVPQALAGAVLLMVGSYSGHAHFHLIQQGIRAPGSIVGFKQKNLGNSSARRSSTLTFMPIVEFQAGEQAVRFEDWLGSSSASTLRNRVTVLYDPARPSAAMIDRPVWNWIPWAPIGAVGVFLILVAIRGWLASS
jgi:uncharacterized protein DUF3592